MSSARLLVLVRAALLTAVFAAAALVIDYSHAGDPAFCGVESSCYKVRVSDVGRVFAELLHPLTLPQLALIAFVIVLGQSFFVRSRYQLSLLAATSGLGGLIGLGFIAVQAKMGSFCAYCMVVDVSAIVAAGAAFALWRKLPDLRRIDAELGSAMAPQVTIPWGVAGFLVTVLPFVWARYPAIAPLPEPLAPMQVAGKTTIVAFTDFECPFCRSLAPHFDAAKARGDVVLVRKMVPLDGHPGALPAALAYQCAPEELREPMAKGLYEAPSLDYTTVVDVAKAAGVGDATAFRKCMADPATKQRVEDDKQLFFGALGGKGLPTTYVGSTMVRGFAPDRLASALTRGASGLELPVWLLFAVSGALVLGAAGHQLRGPASTSGAPDGSAPTPENDENEASSSDDERTSTP
jgi:thiol-disulfide isomerase/thioredoxin